MLKIFAGLIFTISTLIASLAGTLPSQTADRPGVQEVSQALGNNDVEISQQTPELTVSPSTQYAFGNPAGCGESMPILSSPEMLANVQAMLPELDLASLRQDNIWNGPLNTMVDVNADAFAFEFSVDIYSPPSTYLADKAVTVFLENGFVVWFRNYNGSFRLTAIPMIDGVNDSIWGDYVKAYWSTTLPNDEKIYPVMKKLPCHWMIDNGWVNNETLTSMFNLDSNLPDYLTSGRKFLASNCSDANDVSQNQLGYLDAATMCGPLTWKIIKEANSFPYRIGSWNENSQVFQHANPRLDGLPWGGFDPNTYDLIRIHEPMPGYDFAAHNNMFAGDIIYSYSSLYQTNDEKFNHIFLIADVNAQGQRVGITNVGQIYPKWNCSIEEVVLYTPGDQVNGVINDEWNSTVNGRTGLIGFDIFRWKWITYHLSAKPMEYTVRYGDTLETIAFDWKISTQEIALANHIGLDQQLNFGQTIVLPAVSSNDMLASN